MHVPPAWYCVGAIPSAGNTVERRYFGDTVRVTATEAGVNVQMHGQNYRAETALGLVLAWIGPANAAYELPWTRLHDAAWSFLSARPRRADVTFERPFADYFDHWHSRELHQIPIRAPKAWFEGSRCGVAFDAALPAAYANIPLLDKLPVTLKMTSAATLYGMSFAVDELTQGGLKFVNVQCTTPLDESAVEIHTIVGLRSRLPRAAKAKILAAVDRKIALEVSNDLGYWKACADGQAFAWDRETSHDYARYLQWCADLGWKGAPARGPGRRAVAA